MNMLKFVFFEKYTHNEEFDNIRQTKGRLKWFVTKIKNDGIFGEYFTKTKFKTIIPEIFNEFQKDNYLQYFNHIIRELKNNNETQKSFLEYIHIIITKKKFKTIWTFREFEIGGEYILEYWEIC